MFKFRFRLTQDMSGLGKLQNFFFSLDESQAVSETPLLADPLSQPEGQSQIAISQQQECSVQVKSLVCFIE